jgi:Zn-dependent protease
MGGWRIGEVAGIPVRLHWSLLLLGAWIGFTAGGGALGALIGAVLLFASIVAHEVGHALVARAYGIQTRDIVLTPIGGVARLDGMPAKGRAEVAIAIAGPAVSLAIAGLSFAALTFLPVHGLAASVLGSLVWSNGMLGVFNLIPAFPMDGGRVLRGVLAERIGMARATDVAAGIGRAAAIAMGLFGLFGGNTSLVLIAVFVWITSGRERAMAHEHELRARQPEAWDARGRPIEVELVDPWAPRVLRRPVVVRYRY